MDTEDGHYSVLLHSRARPDFYRSEIKAGGGTFQRQQSSHHYVILSGSIIWQDMLLPSGISVLLRHMVRGKCRLRSYAAGRY